MMKSFSKTDVGIKRTVNQDFVFSTNEQIGNLENLYIVADGMGGHKAGDLASRLAVELICEEIADSDKINPLELLKHSVTVANAEIVKRANDDEGLKGMGTTVVAATVADDSLYFVNVGDSRLYLINQGIKQLSKDHSLVEEMVRLGGIKPEDAKHHPDKNIITRAVGEKGKVEIDCFEQSLHKGDIVLMCSDGLSNMIEDDEIFEIVQSSRDVVEIVQNLINKANEYGGSDNIGVVVFEPMVDEVSIC